MCSVKNFLKILTHFFIFKRPGKIFIVFMCSAKLFSSWQLIPNLSFLAGTEQLIYRTSSFNWLLLILVCLTCIPY